MSGRRRRGFSLAEVLITTGILATMTAIVLAMLQSANRRLEFIRARTHLAVASGYASGAEKFSLGPLHYPCSRSTVRHKFLLRTEVQCEGPRGKLEAASSLPLQVWDWLEGID